MRSIILNYRNYGDDEKMPTLATDVHIQVEASSVQAAIELADKEWPRSMGWILVSAVDEAYSDEL